MRNAIALLALATDSRRLSMKLAKFALLAPACLLAACGDASTPTSTAEPAPSSEATFTRTLVRLNPDGTQDVKTVQVTAADQEVERALLLKLPIPSASPTPDPVERGAQVGQSSQATTIQVSCTAYDMTLFDQTNYAGNEICFAGQGQVQLHSYWDCYGRYCFSWDYVMHSWINWSQFEYGYFENQQNFIVYFNTYTSNPNANYGPNSSLHFYN
jgi:hypothetical protein